MIELGSVTMAGNLHGTENTNVNPEIDFTTVSRLEQDEDIMMMSTIDHRIIPYYIIGCL